MPGLVGLVGSGEYLEEMAPIEAELLHGGTRYLQIPTAAAPEGPERLRYWIELGARQAARLGIEAVALPVTSRAEAEDPAIAARVTGADLIYLSGGNPRYLADCLRGTRLLAAICEAWQDGASLAGCSAGAMVLGSWIPGLGRGRHEGAPGLGVLPGIAILPHFDRFVPRPAAPVLRLAMSPPEGVALLGIDELTALVGTWPRLEVKGKGRVLELSSRPWRVHRTGETLVLGT